MAIQPVSDLVLDVANAADPVRRQSALDRLDRLGAGSASGPAFSDMLGAASAPALPLKPGADMLHAGLDNIRDHNLTSGAARTDTLQKFEAFVLGNFIGLMLPKESQAVYGSGLAGEMWQSLMAQDLGEALAKRGGIGIASRIARSYPVAAASPKGG